MPTRRVAVHDDENDDETGLTAQTAVRLMTVNQEQTAESSDEETILDRMRALLNDGSAADKIRVMVYRVRPNTKKLEWCEDYSPDQFEDGYLSMIRDKWGPGDYEFKLTSTGTQSRGVIKITRQNIAPETAPRFTPQQPQQSNELAQVLQSMQETQARMLEALTQRPDADAQMQKTLQMMVLMRQAMGEPAAAPKPADPLLMMREVFTMVREAKGAAKELADESAPVSESDSLMSLAPKVLDLVKLGMANQQQPQNLPMQPLALPESVARPLERNQNPSPMDSTTNPPITAPETPAQLIMRGHIEDLLDIAKAGKTTTEGGQHIYEKLPDELVEHLNHRYWFELIAQIFPIVKPHEEWLRAAKSHADTLFAAEGDDGDGDEDPDRSSVHG